MSGLKISKDKSLLYLGAELNLRPCFPYRPILSEFGEISFVRKAYEGPYFSYGDKRNCIHARTVKPYGIPPAKYHSGRDPRETNPTPTTFEPHRPPRGNCTK